MKKYIKKKNVLIMCAIAVISVMTLGLMLFLDNAHGIKKIKLDLEYNELFTQKELDKRGHKSVITEYITDISTAYNNKDGTKTFYIFTKPIRYINENQQLSLIDTRIANIDDKNMLEKGYVYTIANSDIKPFFPRELSDNTSILLQKDMEYEYGVYTNKKISAQYKKVTNFINKETDMVVYKNALGNGTRLGLYPSSLGNNCEIYFDKAPETNEVSFWVKVSDPEVRLKKESGGYLIMTKAKINAEGEQTDEIQAVIQKPLLKDKSGNVSYDNDLNIISKGTGIYELKFTFDKTKLNAGSTAFISFEMRREKQPDNALYSNFPYLENAYLKNYSAIGNSEHYGIGRLMIRYKFAKLFNLKSEQISKASFHMYSLTDNNDNLEMLSVLEDWCSITGNWNNQYKTGGQVSVFNHTGNEISFDVTKEVMKWCDDESGQMEHNGLLFKSIHEKEGVYNIILSNDNTLYNNRMEITIK